MDDHPALDQRTVVVAGHEGDDALVRSAMADADPRVRIAAIGALERLGLNDGTTLATALDDPDLTVRRRACEAVARRPGSEPPSLLGALADPDPTVAEVAAWATGERQPPEPGAVPALIGLVTDHPDALVREAAVAALGAIGDAVALPTILGALTDKATVRRRAVIALAPFDGPEVEAALAKARADRDWQVRQAAEDLAQSGYL